MCNTPTNSQLIGVVTFMAPAPERDVVEARGLHHLRCAKHKVIPCQGPLGQPGVLGEHTGGKMVATEGKTPFDRKADTVIPIFQMRK